MVETETKIKPGAIWQIKVRILAWPSSGCREVLCVRRYAHGTGVNLVQPAKLINSPLMEAPMGISYDTIWGTWCINEPTIIPCKETIGSDSTRVSASTERGGDPGEDLDTRREAGYATRTCGTLHRNVEL